MTDDEIITQALRTLENYLNPKYYSPLSEEPLNYLLNPNDNNQQGMNTSLVLTDPSTKLYSE